ncbi:MAG: hypothetical protein V5A61_05540 [Haloarculaceae archaeon]|jgi:hypothetical protein
MTRVPTPKAGARGQTLHDFAIGMTVFLLVLGYVFAFVPGLFSPFSPETDSTAIRVDRTADFLAGDLLVEDGVAGSLNETCTRHFFDGSSPAGCDRLSRPVDEAYVRELAALTPRTHVNVTMVRNGSVARDPDPSGDRLAVGPDPASAGERVIRAVRIVSFDGRDYELVVRLW